MTNRSAVTADSRAESYKYIWVSVRELNALKSIRSLRALFVGDLALIQVSTTAQNYHNIFVRVKIRTHKPRKEHTRSKQS